MSQSIVSVSNTSVSAYSSTETYPASHGAGAFTVSKDVRVLSSTGVTDVVDLSPDAQQALQSFLSGGAAGTGKTDQAGASGSDATSSGGMTEISVTAATASTTGYQPNYATASDYDVSWAAADGQSGELDVEEGWSFTTDAQLVPLSPQLQAAEAAPGVTTDATSISLGGRDDGSSAPAAVVNSHGDAQASSEANAALLVLEEGSASSLRYEAFDKAAPHLSTTPPQHA